MSREQLYPLRFKEIIRDYDFGNRKISRLFPDKDVPLVTHLGETWEVCDRPGESSVLLNGPLAGKTLHELIQEYGSDLLGTAIVTQYGKLFPLLIKFLDATFALGEQAHHSDELAKKKGLSDPGKTEAWYMIDTEPDATVKCGSINNLTNEQLVKSIADDTVQSCMRTYKVHTEDAFLLYAGTMHYSSGGVLFYEIMQNSDVFIGLRAPKTTDPQLKMHLAAEAASMVNVEDDSEFLVPPIIINQGKNRKKIVLACEHFALERLELFESYTLSLSGERFYVLTVISGKITIPFGAQMNTYLPGMSILIPASLGAVHLAPESNAVVLCGYVPDLYKDIYLPCKDAGIDDSSIMALGAKTKHNRIQEICFNSGRNGK